MERARRLMLMTSKALTLAQRSASGSARIPAWSPLSRLDLYQYLGSVWFMRRRSSGDGTDAGSGANPGGDEKKACLLSQSRGSGPWSFVKTETMPINPSPREPRQHVSFGCGRPLDWLVACAGETCNSSARLFPFPLHQHYKILHVLLFVLVGLSSWWVLPGAQKQIQTLHRNRNTLHLHPSLMFTCDTFWYSVEICSAVWYSAPTTLPSSVGRMLCNSHSQNPPIRHNAFDTYQATYQNQHSSTNHHHPLRHLDKY